jgi:hypothetical protein
MELAPKENDPALEKLLKKIGSQFKPIYLKVEAERGTALDCFNVVQSKVTKNGGVMTLGWQIWKTTHIIEAEAHAVWQDSQGNFHDISPKQFDVKEICFVRDEKLKYEGKQIDNMRINITANKLVDHLIETFKVKFELQNKGKRAEYYDLSEILTESEIQEIQYVVLLQSGISYLIKNDGNENSFCFCQSGKKYKNCHGENFFVKMKSLM